MRRISLYWPGRCREPYAREGLNKYLKLIKPFAAVELVEVKDARTSGKVQEALLKEEASLLMAAKGDTKRSAPDYVLLDERGAEMNSEEFARYLGRRQLHQFILGGAHGVSDAVKEKARKVLSLSRMTMPHELSRLVFVEQLYRALTIIEGRGYHH